MTKKNSIDNKTLFISGGTGSFGKAFTKTILKKYKPKKVIIFSRDEFKQFEMKQEFSEKELSVLRFFIGDVRDNDRLNLAMQNVDVVIHAAALKQVESSEYNPMECVKTNVFGAENVIQNAIKNNVKKIIALSTDKAANPINLYGATKLASDKIFITANNIVGNKNIMFSVVRYGNVIGSRGSVEPLFRKLKKEKSKFLPITDLEMTRFWIPLSVGVNFTIKCLDRMMGGEVFVPKIPSIKITDLAKAIAPELKIKVIGIRPGEKIHELLCPPEDAYRTIEFSDHYVICPGIKLNKNKNYFKNSISETGKKVSKDFQYNSGSNKHFLKIKEIN